MVIMYGLKKHLLLFFFQVTKTGNEGNVNLTELKSHKKETDWYPKEKVESKHFQSVPSDAGRRWALVIPFHSH